MRYLTLALIFVILSVGIFATEVELTKEAEGEIYILRHVLARLIIEFINVLDATRYEGVSIVFRMKLETIMAECVKMLDLLKVRIVE